MTEHRGGQKRTANSTPDAARAGPSHASKKTRFIEPNEDPVNFAEQVDSSLEDPNKRKGRVKNEGYDSDSSDDGEGVVLSRRKAADEEDAEDDMFAMGEKKEDATGGKKKEEFLRLGDIEGQEFNDEEDESDSQGDEEPEDEDDAERRQKTGMGYELSSFNMREEMEEGKFSSDGTYVRTYDPHAMHDRWMDGVDEKEMKMARRRKRQQERQQREKIKTEEREFEQSGGKLNLEMQLLKLLKKGETVLEALQRLGNQAKKLKYQPKANSNGAESTLAIGKQPQVTTDIDHITHLASTAMSLGDADIYSKTYEELVRSVRASGQVSPDWMPPSADVKYEYKWNVPSQTEQVFGPFSEEDMTSWFGAAYFGDGGEKVLVRKVGGPWGSWNEIVT
ncbi:hypothetical protein CONPUDRAFT_97833 [Coniophora puteana RWD-64-598 SS2]|uniref:GYF domain-containing protein n=1 Tax=Coniophora puteana (strain RWD-64-598) TaxID=741705 RepID=A0A5M3N1D2_CONPW|nr:uncharacterized protein CONPUDRAFT_97833 [Coniophora puteana RWD-64-598 SS2]EIW85116.1 hypothetical protein CONPUDRAFT_97833 [Coniophora puteana RWD-64-598 SS2]